MNRHAYFLAALAGEAHLRSEWVIRAFCVSNLPKAPDEDSYPFQLFEIDGAYGYLTPEGQLAKIPDTDVRIPLLNKDEPFQLKVGDLPNVEKDCVTLLGNVLANAIMFVYPFKHKFPFLLGQFNLGKIEKRIIENLYDDVNEGEEENDKLYVHELIKFIDATCSLTGFNTLFVPGMTEYTLGPAPEALKRMKVLLKEHEHELDNPVVIANIQKEIEVLDREYIASDPDAGFYFKDKSFRVIRMKMYYMYGIEKNFTDDGGYTFIANSLEEGWDLSKLPEMSNTARDGSHKRGAETALGGEKVKIAFRALTGVIVTEEDCGTIVGEPMILHQRKLEEYIGSYLLDKSESKLLTEENIQPYIGKAVIMRSPITCGTGDGNYCIKCVGEFIRFREKTLAARVADAPSQMMGLSMGAMHGKQLKLVTVSIEEALT